MQTKDSVQTFQKAEQGLQLTAEKSAESSNPGKTHESLESVLSSAVTKGFSDLNELMIKLNAVAKSEIEKTAQNTKLMKLMTYLIPSRTVRNLCLDIFEPYIEDVTTLKMFIKGRFNVTMGKGSSKKFNDYAGSLQKPDEGYTIQPWTVEALHRAYHNLEKIPEWQLKLVNNITTCNTTNGGGGVAYWWDGCYNVDYTDDPNQDNDLESQDAAYGHVCTNEDYFRRGLCSFDVTFTHELGHIVDQGGQFSALPDFMAISGWVHEGKDANYIAPKIISEIDGNPYPTDLTKEEIDIANATAVMLVADHVDAEKESVVEFYVTTAAYSMSSMENVRPLDTLTSLLCRSNAYYTIARSFEVSRQFGYDYPCYNEPTRKVKMKHYVHEGYASKGFYSYDSTARAFKISDYQYRDPCEEFAELYAVYHVSNGQNVGEKHKAWFEKMGLHKNTPVQTAIQVGISKTAGSKEAGQQ